MAQTTFTFHSDAAHGWLEVDFNALRDVELEPGDFSAFSYTEGNKFYLEEDCDAPIFLMAHEAKFGRCGIAEVWDGDESRIRTMQRIEPKTSADEYIL